MDGRTGMRTGLLLLSEAASDASIALIATSRRRTGTGGRQETTELTEPTGPTEAVETSSGQLPEAGIVASPGTTEEQPPSHAPQQQQPVATGSDGAQAESAPTTAVTTEAQGQTATLDRPGRLLAGRTAGQVARTEGTGRLSLAMSRVRRVARLVVPTSAFLVTGRQLEGSRRRSRRRSVIGAVCAETTAEHSSKRNQRLLQNVLSVCRCIWLSVSV